jgi:hypothetical protein
MAFPVMNSQNEAVEEVGIPAIHPPLPRSIRITRALFFLISTIWVIFAIVTVRMIDSHDQGSSGLSWILSILMIANAGLLFWVGWRLARQNLSSYILALVVLGANILLTITDEFGIYDAITLAIYIPVFFLLVTTRSKYLSG